MSNVLQALYKHITTSGNE